MHESTLGQWSDSGYNYAIANGQHLTHLKEVTDRLILNSDWIKPTVQNWLVRSLYESPLVYIESVDFTQQEAETCDTILVTYTLVGEEPVTVEVESSGINGGKNYYDFLISSLAFQLIWNFTFWDFKFEEDGGAIEEATAVLEEDNQCPFGTYDVVNLGTSGLDFEAFEVAPISLTVPSWGYEPLNVMNELSRQKTSKRDMLIQEQVTAKRTFDYKSQIL
jgi:hypothetical protein